jgi:hypothetical protein
MPHEQSETYQDENGAWRNYYGGAAGSPNVNGPAMGLRLPLDNARYTNVQDAVSAAKTRSNMAVHPHDEDEETPGMTPLSKSYSDQLRSTMDQLANRPGKFTERPPFDVTNMGKAEGIRAAKPWELFQGERKDAVIADPRRPLAQFVRMAFPKIYQNLEASPTTWDLLIGTRRNAVGSGLPDLYKQGASGATVPDAFARSTDPARIMVREDVWNNILNPKRYINNPDTTVAHELQHALQYGKTPHGQPAAGLPAAQTRGLRLQELFKNASAKDKQLPEFMSQYTERGAPVPYAIREGLTEAAGRSATRTAKRTGNWQRGIDAAKGAGK